MFVPLAVLILGFAISILWTYCFLLYSYFSFRLMVYFISKITFFMSWIDDFNSPIREFISNKETFNNWYSRLRATVSGCPICFDEEVTEPVVIGWTCGHACRFKQAWDVVQCHQDYSSCLDKLVILVRISLVD
jgi:hypothetical protein